MQPAIPRLTETEAAQYLCAKPQTLRKWRSRGVGPAFLKLTGQIKYRLDDLDKFVEQSRVVPGERRPRRRRRAA